MHLVTRQQQHNCRLTTMSTIAKFIGRYAAAPASRRQWPSVFAAAAQRNFSSSSVAMADTSKNEHEKTVVEERRDSDPRGNFEKPIPSNSHKGFASMPKEKVREIASKGGHASHRGHTSEKNVSEERDKSEDEGGEHKGNQGFASMPKEKVREIASKGGRSSHGGGRKSSSKDNTDAESNS